MMIYVNVTDLVIKWICGYSSVIALLCCNDKHEEMRLVIVIKLYVNVCGLCKAWD